MLSKTITIIRGLLGILILTSAACSLTPAEKTPPPELPEDIEPLVALAKFDLMEDLDVNPEKINLVSAEETEFQDASLGVPTPGASYAQVITPGYIIILEYDGMEYRYHASSQRVVQVPKNQ